MPRDGIPEGITRNDVLNAITAFDAGTVNHDFHDSDKYDLLFEGKRYPPKAILGIAAQRVLGRVLQGLGFGSGQGSL